MNTQKNISEQCLSRTDWIVSLMKIFELVSNGNSTISLELYLRFFLSSSSIESMDLISLDHYSKSEECMTFNQVYQKLSSMPTQISWDSILDSIISKPSSTLFKAKKAQTNYPAPSLENYCTLLNEDFNDLSKSIIYLNLSSSALLSLPKYPETIKILNISNNALSELCIESSIEYLNANQNLLESLTLSPQSFLEECYLKDNKLTECRILTRAKKLKILDLSLNSIEDLEDLTFLSFNSNLKVFSIRENPVLDSNKDFIEKTFSYIIKLNAENCIESSKCPQSSVLLGQPLISHKRNYTLPLELNRMPSSRKPCKAYYITPTGTSERSSPTGMTSANKSVFYHFSPICKENIDRKTMKSSQRRSNSTLVTPQSIARAANISYGNPIAALMIKPSQKRRLSRKKQLK